MMRICLYGAPGSGKTTLSQALHKRLNILLIEGDYLRPLAQEQTSSEDDPFLYVGTKEAWKKFGGPTSENIIKGLLAVRLSMASYVQKELNRTAPYIFEAAFVDPSKAKDVAKLFLIVTLDEALHRSQYFTHRKPSAETEVMFRVTREIQNYLIAEAKAMGVVIIDPSVDGDGEVDKAVEALVSLI